MEEICRLCCSSSFVQHEIFGPEDELYARMGPFLFAPLQVRRGDGLPQRVCDACRARILQLHQFCSEAQCVQDRLRALVTEMAVKRELSPEPCWVGVSFLGASERSSQTENVLQSEATIWTDSATQTEQIYFKVEAADSVKQLNTIDEDNTCEPPHTTFVETKQQKIKSVSKRGESPTQYKCKAKRQPLQILQTFPNDQDSDDMNYEHSSNLQEQAYQGSYSEEFVQLKDLQEQIQVIGSSDSEEHIPLIKLRTKKIKRSAKRKSKKNAASVSNSMKKIKEKQSKIESTELKEKEVETDSESDGLEELVQFQRGRQKRKRKSKVRHEDPHACWCCVCSQTMPSRAACLQHYESHLSEGPGPALPLPMPVARVCPRCSKAPSPADWPAHWARHQQRPHYCKLCRHSFAHFRNLVAHGIKYHARDEQKIKKHKYDGARKYMCDLCPRKYASMKMLKRHHNIVHDTDRVLRARCGLCAYKASCPETLERHLKRRHAPPHSLCPHCGKNFASYDSLKLHLAVHSGEKPYKCQYCDRGFAYWTTWRAHERIHTGEKPHVCGQCSRGFTQRTALMTHVRGVHTRERPYPCTRCGKAFTTRYMLNAHLKKPCGRADSGTVSD